MRRDDSFWQLRLKRSAAELFNDPDFVEDFKGQWIIIFLGQKSSLQMRFQRPARAGTDLGTIADAGEHLNPLVAACTEKRVHRLILRCHFSIFLQGLAHWVHGKAQLGRLQIGPNILAARFKLIGVRSAAEALEDLFR